MIGHPCTYSYLETVTHIKSTPISSSRELWRSFYKCPSFLFSRTSLMS